jgi:hypothetical protein
MPPLEAIMGKYNLKMKTPDGDIIEWEVEYILIVGVQDAPKEDDSDIALQVMGNLSYGGVGRFLLTHAEKQEDLEGEVH